MLPPQNTPHPTKYEYHTKNAFAAINSQNGLVVNISEAEVQSQMTPETKVDFLEAVKQALTSYLEDGSLSESPLWIMQVLPGEYGLPSEVDEETATEKVRELLNTSGCQLMLMTEASDPNDEWAGKVMCDELDETFGTSEYWIFGLYRSPFTDLNDGVVHKGGQKPTLNWGAS